jgi:hypothetical protein
MDDQLQDKVNFKADCWVHVQTIEHSSDPRVTSRFGGDGKIGNKRMIMWKGLGKNRWARTGHIFLNSKFR